MIFLLQKDGDHYMASFYTDKKVAQIVEKDIENFAKAVTDSYFQTYASQKYLNPAEYAQLYFKVYKQSLQSIEAEITKIQTKDQDGLEVGFNI